MDQLRETPVSNDYALALSKLLRGGRDFANKANVPVIGPLGDVLVGQAPEEVEHWAYGNSPLVMPPSGTGARIPQVKTGRKQMLADALLAAPTGGMGGAGHAMITAGGDPRLMLLRRTGVDNIKHDMETGKVLRGSYAITDSASDLDADNFGHHILLPHPRSLDPAKNPKAELFNTDAWTATGKPGPYGDSRMSGESLKSLLELGIPPDQAANVVSSPRFQSLKDFEKSRHGGRRILNPNSDLKEGEQLMREIESELPNLINKDISSPQTRALINKLRSGTYDTGSDQLVRYAELKDTGSLPFNSDHFAGMFLDPNFIGEESFSALSKKIKNRTGIPVTKYDAYDDVDKRLQRFTVKKAKF